MNNFDSALHDTWPFTVLTEDPSRLTANQHSGAALLSEPSASSRHRSSDVAHRLREFVMSNLHRSPALKDLAQFLGYSDKYCSDLFKARIGMPFSQYVKELRLERAARLLSETDLTLSSIAETLGFSDQFAFSHFFKNAVGCAPAHYRARVNGRPRGLCGFHRGITKRERNGGP